MKIAQCWDDGVHDDIRVIEILRKHGAKGSFNLNYGLHGPERKGGWNERWQKDIYKLALSELTDVYAGFTIANHSLTHPHLEQVDAAEAERQIREGRETLEQHFGYAITGFVYPFGTYNETVQEIVRATGHVYARTTKNVAHVFPPDDPTAFHPSCHFHASDFRERFNAAAESDPNGVFYFWGHSYEIVTEAQWEAFDNQIEWISAQPGVEWVELTSLFATP